MPLSTLASDSTMNGSSTCTMPIVAANGVNRICTGLAAIPVNSRKRFTVPSLPSMIVQPTVRATTLTNSGETTTTSSGRYERRARRTRK